MIELINVVWKWKIPIAIMCAVAAVASVVASLMMPNYYKSTIKFLAANPYMIDRSAIFSKTPGENPVYMFGASAEMDRLVAIGKSSPLINYVINKYKLKEHYEIDPKDELADFKVRKKLSKNYTIIKNPLDVIEVSVEDKDKSFAAVMANDIAHTIDSMHLKILSSSKHEMAKMLDYTVSELSDKVSELSDSISTLNRIGKTADVKIIENVRENVIEELSETQVVREQYLTVANTNMSSIYVLQNAAPAVYKSRPTRSLIVLSTLFLTLLFCSILAIIYEQIKNYEGN